MARLLARGLSDRAGRHGALLGRQCVHADPRAVGAGFARIEVLSLAPGAIKHGVGSDKAMRSSSLDISAISSFCVALWAGIASQPDGFPPAP